MKLKELPKSIYQSLSLSTIPVTRIRDAGETLGEDWALLEARFLFYRGLGLRGVDDQVRTIADFDAALSEAGKARACGAAQASAFGFLIEDMRSAAQEWPEFDFEARLEAIMAVIAPCVGPASVDETAAASDAVGAASPATCGFLAEGAEQRAR